MKVTLKPIRDRAARREPIGMLDPTRVAEPMDCRSRRGTRSLHAAPRGNTDIGLKNATLVRVAAADAMRYVEGSEQNFPAGFFFLREDLIGIKEAFEKHPVPLKEYSKPGELIALRHAVKSYLGCDSGLAAVIRAVIDGSLAPVGYASRFRGITGYLFRSEELRKYRPVPEVKARPEVFLNFREAAFVLGIKSNIVRGLVAQGLLGVAGGMRTGLPNWYPRKKCYISRKATCQHRSSPGDSGSTAVLLRAT